jgi:dGTPase
MSGFLFQETFMTIREMIEEREELILSPYAALSKNSKGRDTQEPECDIRPVYQRDRDRIVHCKAFRRLKDKTQVYLIPEGDHYRTRLTHTLEVSQIARTISKALRLNEDLTEAIALGHDLGHTPFGHAGERALNGVCPYRFKHNEQSVRTVEKLEKDGRGLNLTWEVRDGILNHQTSRMPHTLEGKVVRLSDKIAYIHHDMDDAVRGGVLTESDVPQEIRKVLGSTPGDRLDTFMHDIITNSTDKDDIIMSDDVARAMADIRRFMFERVYTNPDIKAEEGKAEALVCTLYDYYLHHPEKLPEENRRMVDEGEALEIAVCDFVGAMTDRFAILTYNDLFVPKSWEMI